VLWCLDTCSTQHSSVHQVRMHSVSNRDIHLYSLHNNPSVLLTTILYVQWIEQITNALQSGWRALRDSVLSSLTSAPTLLKLPCQEQRGSSLTTFAPVSVVSAPAYTNGVWPPLRPVMSVAQKNKPSTIHRHRCLYTNENIWSTIMESNLFVDFYGLKHTTLLLFISMVPI